MTNDLHSGQLACLEDGVMTGMIGIMGRGSGDTKKKHRPLRKSCRKRASCCLADLTKSLSSSNGCLRLHDRAKLWRRDLVFFDGAGIVRKVRMS